MRKLSALHRVGAWIIFPVLTLPILAESGSAPAYVSSMADYSVRNLSGLYAPSNGKISIADVTPAEWLNDDPSVMGLRGVIIAWSGGAKGIGSKLFVHGGGHNDSANNGVYIYDFSGSETPTGWEDPVISELVAVSPNTAVYSDGNPTSVHTYDGVVYADHDHSIYRFGGSRYSSGDLTTAAFKFDVAEKEWVRLPDYPGRAGAAKTIYDRESGKIFVTMNGAYEGYFFRTDTDTWSSAKSYGGDGFPFDSTGAWDASRNRGIIVGQGETSIVALDFGAETVSVSEFIPQGDTEIFAEGGISAFYDPTRDVYWVFGGSGNSPGWTNIYELGAEGSWTTLAHPLTGSEIVRDLASWGSYGRYVFLDQWRAIGLVAHHNSPAYVIKLPGDLGPSPKPPAEFKSN